MNSSIPPNSALKVSVVIPARNEEANLERCLRSLVTQKGVAFEILVVNDSSTDRTRTIAESFTRVRQCPFMAMNQDLRDVNVIDSPEPLPAGWTGKANALNAAECVTGEAALKGQWILFTDADTEHLDGSLAAAVAEAQEHNVDLLSYSPEQLLTGIRQQLLMPVIFGELAMRYSPRRISDPAMPDAAANGQYLLVRASTHRKLGGFATVATELLEDVALARRYKSKGKTIRFRLGQGLVRTRMYSSWDDLRIGWTKNLALLFPDARDLAQKRTGEFYRLLLSVAFSVFWSLIVVARGVTAVDWLVYVALIALVFYTLSNFALFYLRVSRSHFGVWSTLLSFFGLPLFSSLLRESADAHEKGSVNWRGRSYQTARVEEAAAASNPK